MKVEVVEMQCDIFGIFKVGDNVRYNLDVLSALVQKNEAAEFSKPVVIQIASILEAACQQIFYRARNFNREGVPQIAEKDRLEIAIKQIDRFNVIIDNLRKYGLLNGLGAEVYDDLHKLRRLRNKIHIQSVWPGGPRDEDELFDEDIMLWTLDLNYKVLEYLAQTYPRPAHIAGQVGPLMVPRSV